MYSLEELESARLNLTAVQERFDRYSGNNPDKYRADIESARLKVHSIEKALIASGLLPQSATEKRDAELYKAFPNARSKQIVEWKGKKYIRRFSPASQSLSGKTVNAWKKYWEDVAD